MRWLALVTLGWSVLCIMSPRPSLPMHRSEPMTRVRRGSFSVPFPLFLASERTPIDWVTLSAIARPDRKRVRTRPTRKRVRHRVRQKANRNEIAWLAHVIMAEAGNQPLLGQIAVADVVLHRWHLGVYGKTIQQVIFAPGQFSSVENGSIWETPSRSSWKAAAMAFAGRDVVRGALYFEADGGAASFMQKLPLIAHIGQQSFYGWRRPTWQKKS